MRNFFVRKFLFPLFSNVSKNRQNEELECKQTLTDFYKGILLFLHLQKKIVKIKWVLHSIYRQNEVASTLLSSIVNKL